MLAAPSAGAASYPFSETFEAGTANWTLGGTWQTTSAQSLSPTHALTDSVGTFYTNLVDSAAAMAGGLNLSAAVRPALRFYHRHGLEDDFDFGSVEVSTDGGASWGATLASYTGTRASWTRDQLSLDAYAGQSDVRLRFRLETDESVVMDGWYLDDVYVGERPADFTLVTATNAGPNRIDLAWSAPSSGAPASYVVLRSMSAGVDWRTAYRVATLPGTTTSCADIAVGPKRTYHYRVMALDANGLHSLSDERAVTTPVGMDFPFLDNGEGGGSMWTAEAPWAISEEASASGERSWSDSPGTNYANSVNRSLTIVAPLDLRGAVNPVLCFAHQYEFAGGDSGNAEVSANGGTDWTTLGTFTGSSAGAWRQQRYSLAAYTNSANVLIRFRVTTDASGTADGWHVDDISVSPSPTVVNAPLLTEVASHSMRVTWAPNADALFSHYAVYRATASGVGFSSALVTNLHDQATVTCVDSGLALDTAYYYRVYAVNAYGAFSPDGTESVARTLNHPAPFVDGFESGLQGWNVTGQWALTPLASRSGGASLTDSPGTTYVHNRDTYAQTAVDLSGTTWPVLRFWDRYAVGNGDWIRVEISPNGSSWSHRYGVYGGTETAATRTNWMEQVVDLSEWKGQPNVRIRFHIATDGNAGTVADGWYIDDVSVTDRAAGTVYPVREGFEDAGWSNRWLSAGWVASTNNPWDGAAAMADRPSALLRIGPDVNRMLVLADEVNLVGATAPQLVFWARGTITGPMGFQANISDNGGSSWGNVQQIGASENWTRYQIDLSAYVGKRLRLRFNMYSYWGDVPLGQMLIDGVVVQDRPAGSVLQVPVPHLKSMDLSWTASGMGTAFSRYELYRSSDATINAADTLVYSGTNPAVTTFTDVGPDIGLDQGTLYYYGLFTVDTNEVQSAVSPASAWTLVQPIGFTNMMENMLQLDRSAGSTWGGDSGLARTGGSSVGDSPGVNYSPSRDTYMQFCVDLSTAVWPVLRFWDRYTLGNGDWLRVEISHNGSSWYPRYGLYVGTATPDSRTNWVEQAIDLSSWKGQSNVRIRFRLWTDGGAGTTADGWNIDDLSVTDQGASTVPYSYYQGFETTPADWQMVFWTPSSAEAYERSRALGNGVGHRMAPDTAYWATLGRAIDLTGAVSPTLTCWLKGRLNGASNFRVQVSVNGGVAWSDLGAFNLDSGASLTAWTRRQTSLAAYIGQVIRLRIQSSTYWSETPESPLYVDAFGIGEAAPAAPSLVSPLNLESMATLTPTLVVSNAFDYQTDPLSYRFEVYSDSGLSNLVAVVPVLASGTGTTAWQVDPPLENDAQYWWRCRANDGAANGPWMPTATFYANHSNTPPERVTLVGPPAASILHDLGYMLSWRPTTDPDEGDTVAAYHVQAATNEAFGAPVIDDTNVTATVSTRGTVQTISVPLGDVAGSGGLQENTSYYWRVRARDNWDLYSGWSTNTIWFIYGTPPPTLRAVTREPDGDYRMAWDRCGKGVYIEFAPELSATSVWMAVDGPIYDTNAVIRPLDEYDHGYFRTRTE